MTRLTKEAEADTVAFMRQRYAAKAAERTEPARAAKAAAVAARKEVEAAAAAARRAAKVAARELRRRLETAERAAAAAARAEAKKNPPLRRSDKYAPDKLKAAYLAGQGRSADEIADQIGGTTSASIWAMLSKHDIRLTRTGGEHGMAVRWKASDRIILNREALRLDRQPAELAALLIRAVVQRRPELVGELIDEMDVVGI